MLPEVLLESLRFLDRDSLEACQLLSRAYKAITDKANSTLALHPMGTVVIVRVTSYLTPHLVGAHPGFCLFMHVIQSTMLIRSLSTTHFHLCKGQIKRQGLPPILASVDL